MAVAMQGLRVRPQYEHLIHVAVHDKLYNIKYPNRVAQFFFTKGFCFKSIRRRRDEGDGKTTRTSKQRIV